MKRAVLIILSILTFLIAIPALIVGAVLTAIGAGDNPSISGRLGEVQSPGYAVVSERVEVDWDYLVGDEFDVTIGVRGASSDVPVFIGYGPTSAVDAYLAGAAITLVDDLGDPAWRDREIDVPGSVSPGPPGDETFWIEQSSGPGLQEIPLSLASGDYRIVAMNADASAGVNLEVHGSIDVPFLLPVGIGLLIFGGLLTVLAIVLLVFGIRASRNRAAVAPPAPYGYAQPTAPPGQYGYPHPTAPPGSYGYPQPVAQPGPQYPPGAGQPPPQAPSAPQPGAPPPGAGQPPPQAPSAPQSAPPPAQQNPPSAGQAPANPPSAPGEAVPPPAEQPPGSQQP